MDHKFPNYIMATDVLPEVFLNDDICSALNGHVIPAYDHSLAFTCGLVIRVRNGVKLLYKKSQYKFPKEDKAKQPVQFWDIVHNFTKEHASISLYWTPETLWLIAEELSQKSLFLSVPLQKELSLHPLYPIDPIEKVLRFHNDFIARVVEYHHSVRRPEGTFDVRTIPHYALVEQLVQLPRIPCPLCNGKRQVYCGVCSGLQMENAQGLLPERVTLPFDVLLLLHHQESLIKCTGIHAAVLGKEDQTQYEDWLKPDEEWQRVVESLDASRDVLLFPYPDSTPAQHFPWQTDCEPEQKKRLVVLEASWTYGKTMAQQIVAHRRRKGLPALPSVTLTDVTGQYWRFQSEGQSAVSTIEAIAYAAQNAGLESSKVQDLLVLFGLQKYRVLKNLVVREDGRIPRAIEVSGNGMSSWKTVVGVEREAMMQQLGTEEALR